jgi:hypothetical protein
MSDLSQNIPSHWKTVKLGEVCFTTSSGTPSRKRNDYYNENIPWVKSGELEHIIILSHSSSDDFCCSSHPGVLNNSRFALSRQPMNRGSYFFNLTMSNIITNNDKNILYIITRNIKIMFGFITNMIIFSP